MDWVVVGAQWLHVLLGIIWFGNSVVVAAILIPSLNPLPIPIQRDVGSRYGERTTRLFNVLVPVLIVLGVVRGTVLGPIKDARRRRSPKNRPPGRADRRPRACHPPGHHSKLIVAGTHDPPTQGERPMITTLRRRHLLLTAGMTLLLGACSGTSAPAATTGANGGGTAPAQQPTASGGAAAPTTKPAGGGGTTTLGSVDPCSLLTQAEVDAAVGQPLGPGKPFAGIPHYGCDWATTDFAAGVGVKVSDWAAIKTAATSTGTATSVPGVGDEALYKGGGLLYVRKGDVGFLLWISGPHVDKLPDQGLAQEEVLAAAVLGRL